MAVNTTNLPVVPTETEPRTSLNEKEFGPNDLDTVLSNEVAHIDGLSLTTSLMGTSSADHYPIDYTEEQYKRVLRKSDLYLMPML